MSGGVLPFSLNHIPGKNALLASDPGVGYDIFDLDAPKTRAAGVSTPIPNQGANCWSVYSKESKNFYIIDVAKSVLTEVTVNSSLNSTIVKVCLTQTTSSRNYVDPLIYFQQYNVAPDGPLDSDVATVGKKEYARAPFDRDVLLMAFSCSFIYSLSANVTGLAVYAVNGVGKASVYQRLDVAGPAKAAKLPISE